MGPLAIKDRSFGSTKALLSSSEERQRGKNPGAFAEDDFAG